MKKSKHDLTEGSILKNLLHLAVPITLSNTLQDSFHFIDLIFVSKLGPEAIAAVNMGGDVVRLLLVVSLGISTGAMIMVAQFIGAKEKAQGENIAMQSLLLSAMCALGIGALGYPFAELGLKLLGAEENVIGLGVPYMRITLIGSITRFLFMTLLSIFRGAGDAMTPMIVLIFSTIVNIVLDPLLIFGIWKFPSLGVMGSAYAAIIGNGLSVVIFLYLCFSGRSVISLRHVERRVNWSAMGKILNLGGFSAMQGFLRDVSRVMFIGFVAAYGTYAVAAYAICMRLRLFVMNPGFGISNAVGPMVGQNLGANQMERAEKSARVASRVAVAIMGFTGIVFFLFPRYFVGIFSDQTAEVLEIGIVFLRWLSATFGFIAVSLVLGRALNGAGDTMTPMVITGVSQLGIGLLLVFVLSHLIGMVGIWMGIALSNVVQGLIIWFWFKRGTWKTKKLVHGK